MSEDRDRAQRNPDAVPALEAPRPSVWYAQRVITKSMTGESSVPCGTCTACCRTYDAVVLRPGEVPAEGLKLVPGTRQLQKQADGMRCIHLIEGMCEVYDKRPLACRDYDCRMWYFAGVTPPPDDKIEPLRLAIRRWRTHIESEDDALVLYAMRRAAAAVGRANPGMSFEQVADRAFEMIPDALKRLKLEGGLRKRVLEEMRDMEQRTGGQMFADESGKPGS